MSVMTNLLCFRCFAAGQLVNLCFSVFTAYAVVDSEHNGHIWGNEVIYFDNIRIDNKAYDTVHGVYTCTKTAIHWISILVSTKLGIISYFSNIILAIICAKTKIGILNLPVSDVMLLLILMPDKTFLIDRE